MLLREFFFKTTSHANLLCQFTRREAGSWILIHLFRPSAGKRADRGMFTIHARPEAIERFLTEEFGRRYGTYEVLNQQEGLASIEVTNYLLPSYRGMDPVELATNLLGKDAFVMPILVEDGYMNIRVVGSSGSAARQFGEVLKRIGSVTSPDDFKLIHTGEFDPVKRLRPRGDALSPRQDEMLRMAIELGYYDEPRKCTLDTLAKQFGVSKAAVHKRLVSAEGKIMKGHYQ